MTLNYYRAYNKLLSLTNLQLTQYSASKAELIRSLKRTRALLDCLKNPEKKLQFIHITGTSGKGSVAQMLHSILQRNHKKVGTYTSPHTTSYLERFQVNEKLIDPELLSTAISDVINAYEKLLTGGSSELSFFELSTCLAIYAFAKANLEWCILEVGCGGRFDATNVIPTPRVAIITNVDLDHTELLGKTLAKIAYEKAGIIKKNGIVFCGEQRPALQKIFSKVAKEKNARLMFINSKNQSATRAELGEHQRQNASIAQAVAREIGIPNEIIEQTLERIKLLPCRFELIQKNPTIILDGAHSPAKIKATIALIEKLPKKPLIIFGCTASKNAREMLSLISPVVASITTTRFETTMRKAANPFSLLRLIPKSKQNKAFLDWRTALSYVENHAKKTDIILVTGSLYLAGDMRTEWITEEQILKNRSSFI